MTDLITPDFARCRKETTVCAFDMDIVDDNIANEDEVLSGTGSTPAFPEDIGALEGLADDQNAEPNSN